MELILRRTYKDHPREEDNDKFWSVLHQGLLIGSINESMGPSDEPPRWSWSLIIHAPGMKNTSGHEASREDAMRSFRRAFEKEMHRIGVEGWQAHVQHMRWLEARSGPNRY